MKKNSISEIRDNIQRLDTSILQMLNSNPPENVQKKLYEARERLRKCEQVNTASLRIVVAGEANSGVSDVFNAMLDTNDLCPVSSSPLASNLLEVKIAFKDEERAIYVKNCNVHFFNEQEVWESMGFVLADLARQGIAGLPKSVRSFDDLAKLEDSLVGAYESAKNQGAKYSVLGALEYVMALRFNSNLVDREQGHESSISKKMLANAIHSNNKSAYDQGVQSFYAQIQQAYGNQGAFNTNDELDEAKLQMLFPLIKKVTLEAEVWGAPFGIEDAENANPVMLVNASEHGESCGTARERFLCAAELKNAHSVIAVLNAANPGSPDASSFSQMLQQSGKVTSDRVIVVANRFDEFRPLPSEANAQAYAGNFSKLIAPVKALVGKSSLYPCSNVCYLFDAKSKRGNWKFGDAAWFNDNKRQTSNSLYKRNENDFKKLLQELTANKKSGDLSQMAQAIQRYVDGAGIPALRQDIVSLARSKGGKGLQDNSLKEFNAVCKMLDDISSGAPAESKGIAINSEVAFKAQEFYRTLELAVADALPGGQSEYKNLKIKDKETDIAIWDSVDKEIAARVASWPEWFAILNQGEVKQTSTKPSKVPQKTFSRYAKIKKTGCSIPTEFKAFNERFISTTEGLTQYTLENVAASILYSIQRLETHPDYLKASQDLQSVLDIDRLPEIEEALPLLDAWQPSRMAQEELIPEIMERISDEVEDLKNIRFPYDTEKPCFWNLALIIRIQVQLIKTLRDRISRLIASSENQFQTFFVNEVLRAEILPLVRSSLNNTQFLASACSSGYEPQEQPPSWEETGKGMKSLLDDVKNGKPAQNTPEKASPGKDVPAKSQPSGKVASGKPAPSKPVKTTYPAAPARNVPAAPPIVPEEDEETFDTGVDAPENVDLDDELEEW